MPQGRRKLVKNLKPGDWVGNEDMPVPYGVVTRVVKRRTRAAVYIRFRIIGERKIDRSLLSSFFVLEGYHDQDSE